MHVPHACARAPCSLRYASLPCAKRRLCPPPCPVSAFLSLPYAQPVLAAKLCPVYTRTSFRIFKATDVDDG